MPPRIEDEPSLIRQASFVLFWSARVLSTSCFQIVSVVIGWQIYALTSSTFDLGLVGLCQFLPMLLLIIPAGHIADRFDRRVVVRTCQIIEGLTAATLALASWLGVISPHVIFAAAALISGMGQGRSNTGRRELFDDAWDETCALRRADLTSRQAGSRPKSGKYGTRASRSLTVVR